MSDCKTIQARNVRVGDRILTSNGMREVLDRVPRSFGPGQKPYGIMLVVDDVCGPPWRAELLFKPEDKVSTRRATKES